MSLPIPESFPTHVTEPQRRIPVQDNFDVLVCGAGPAGIGAAISAARIGARVALVDFQGCLGGVWTNGLLTYILDGRQKSGIMAEIRRRLSAEKALAADRDLFDVEPMKYLLEEMCAEAGVHVRLHARLCSAARVATHTRMRSSKPKRDVSPSAQRLSLMRRAMATWERSQVAALNSAAHPMD